MYLEIVTPEKKLFAGDIKLIRLPGSKGSFEILDQHAPIISTLEKGQIKVIDENGSELFFEVKRGVAECVDNNVIVLVDS
ncbi:MAG: ATP synthase F1 subunit epsilon [Bacteroidales bacterium]|nr:ATP synthase F1 subunit epsilon [Bacteroidales bacterium]